MVIGTVIILFVMNRGKGIKIRGAISREALIMIVFTFMDDMDLHTFTSKKGEMTY